MNPERFAHPLRLPTRRRHPTAILVNGRRASWTPGGSFAGAAGVSVGEFSFTPSQELRDELLEDPDIVGLPDKLTVVHRFVGHGNRDWRTDTEEYDVSLGVRRRLAGNIGYDAHLRYYRHEAAEDGNTFVSESAIREAIAEGRYDVENPLSTTPEHLAAIRETGLRLDRVRVTDHKTARASLDGTALALAGGDMRWAAGAEIAFEEWRNLYGYRDVHNRSYKADDVLGSGGSQFSGERRRWSAFAEVSLPLHRDLDVGLSGRRDDHDDVGATFSHQVASRYRLSEALMVRGSWGRRSKAPGLNLLNLEQIDYPFICDTKTFTGDLKDCRRFQVERMSGGNPNLKPDDGENFSLGASTACAR